MSTMSYQVYILHSKSLDRYYIGSTQDIPDRLNRHNSGRSKYTKAGVPWELVYAEDYTTRAEAVKREHQLKSWKNRARIESLVRTSRQ